MKAEEFIEGILSVVGMTLVIQYAVGVLILPFVSWHFLVKFW